MNRGLGRSALGIVFLFLASTLLTAIDTPSQVNIPPFEYLPSGAESPSDGVMDIVLMGNSYTYQNDLDQRVAATFEEIGLSNNVTRLTSGGMRLEQHANRAATSADPWNLALTESPSLDVVVLQDQSQIPSFPESEPMWQASRSAVISLDAQIEEAGAVTMLMMTWGRRDGDAGHPTLNPDFSTMQANLEHGYLAFAEAASTDERAIFVAPVGLAFRHIHDAIVRSGGAPTDAGTLFHSLYASDGSHPSPRGSYLAACVLHASLTGQPTVGLSDGGLGLTSDVLLALQQAADATVFNETTAFAYPWGAPLIEIDPWNLTGREIAVPDGFTQNSLMDYSDVAVLINNRSDASRTIGWAFVTAREIPLSHVFLFDHASTPTGETINRDQFNTYFADPLRLWLSESNRSAELNHLVTTKGIPLRINGGDDKASFDSEISLIGGTFDSNIGQDWWFDHSYGPLNGGRYESFSRTEHGFYLVSRLTGYTVDTALSLIEKTNNSLGQRGQFVLDLATNRNGSGYKYWNDDLYVANTSLNETLNLPVHFDEESDFVTNLSNVIAYASWGSNDGSWSSNQLLNAGFDTADGAWLAGARYWSCAPPPLSGEETFEWSRQTVVTKDGSAALEGVLNNDVCTTGSAASTSGLLAEYFDNTGFSFNSNTMPNLTGRVSDFFRIEPVINHASTSNTWAGLDDRFKDHFSVRYTGFLTIPEAGNWTFHLGSDDGSMLWLDGVEIIDHGGTHGYSEVSSNPTWYEAGQYHVRIEMFEWGGGAGVGLSWTGPNMAKTLIANQYWTVGGDSIVHSDALVHHWTFDEGNGVSIGDSVSGANLTLYGSSPGSNWVAGVDGKAYHFDGIDEYAEVDVSDWNGDFSLSMWVKTDNSSQKQFASAIAVSDVAGDDHSFQIHFSGGTNGDWEVRNNVSHKFGTVEAGIWTHLAVTFENDSMKQFLNGRHVRTTAMPDESIDDIQLFKFGVNRAGSTYYQGLVDEVMIWNTSLNDSEILSIYKRIVVDCPEYNSVNQATTSAWQEVDIGDDLKGHAWYITGYAMKKGWINGDYRIVVDGYAENGTLMSSDSSSTNSLLDDWSSRTMRFRPHAGVSDLSIRIEALLHDGTYNGSIFFDSIHLIAIRPHMQWVDGSIAETAVSTGARSFNEGTGYGQSLVADLLEDGVSGVKGYVYEPYLTTVAYPSVMTTAYANGYTWAESISMANPASSWMGVVVGDPKMAAYADTLHDVVIVDVKNNGTLVTGRNGSIFVLVENVGMSPADGFLQVRIPRLGDMLLSEVAVILPAGDAFGSRSIVEVPIPSQGGGYLEVEVRWVKNISQNLSRERVTHNNAKSFHTVVNDPPLVDRLECTRQQVPRGGAITCLAHVSDDGGIFEVALGWRVNSSLQGEVTEWVWVETTISSSENIYGFAIIRPPPSVPLGVLDLAAVAYDDLGTASDRFVQSSVAQVIDAPASWYGMHVLGIDDEGWLGYTELPPSPPLGLARGTTTNLTACSVDLDHDRMIDTPQFLVSKGELGDVVPLSDDEPTLWCYTVTWTLPMGGDISDVQLSVEVQGQLVLSRTVMIIDRAPDVMIELRGPENTSRALANTIDDMLLISVEDADDPLLNEKIASVTLTWPEIPSVTLQHRIEAGSSSALVALPSPSILKPGVLKVHVIVIGAHEVEGNSSRTWEVTLPPASDFSTSMCINSESVDSLRSGPSYNMVVTYTSPAGTQVMTATATLTDGTLIPLTLIEYAEYPVVEACLKSSLLEHQDVQAFRFDLVGFDIVTGDYLHLLVELIDGEGRSSSNSFNWSLVNLAPIVILEDARLVEDGSFLYLYGESFDPDGDSESECSALLIAEDLVNLTVVDVPVKEGVIDFDVPLFSISPGQRFTVEITCADNLGAQTSLSWDRSFQLSSDGVPSEVISSDSRSSASDGDVVATAFTPVIIIISIVLLLILFLVVKGRSPPGPEVDENFIAAQDTAWALWGDG